MTKIKANEILENVTSKGLFSVIVFYRSPITNTVEERHIYADANSEVWAIADLWKKNYKDLGFDFLIYVNKSIEYSNDYYAFEFDE